MREEANEAIRCMDGIVPDGGVEKLSVRIAEEHGKQKAAYYAGWQAGFNQNRGIFFIITVLFFICSSNYGPKN